MNDNNSNSVFSHTRIKMFKNKILSKFNNPEWKQNQYYVKNLCFIKRHVFI